MDTQSKPPAQEWKHSKLSADDFDILILDVVLPDLRGDDLVRELRLKDKDVGIILVTGFPILQRCINVI
mgnify:CR=1 FL=1